MENILNIKVSAFANAMDIRPTTINLYEWLVSGENRDLVERIRDEIDLERRAELKRQLPCVTPSGIFSKRSKNSLLKHSGFICIDIDMKPNSDVENFDDLKSLIRDLKCVAYCSLSASGKGYFLLIPISDTKRHKEHFESLKLDFISCGIEIDASCGDISRLRFASYDEDPYINMNAIPYNKIIPSKTAYVAKPLKSIMKQGADQESVEDLLNTVEQAMVDITQDYKAWFAIGCSIASEFGEQGREYFHRVSQFYSGYDSDETDKQYSYCINDKNPHTIATLFWYAQQRGLIQSAVEKDFNIQT